MLIAEHDFEIDGRHPALTELSLDAVAAFEGCVQVSDGVGAGHAHKMQAGPQIREH